SRAYALMRSQVSSTRSGRSGCWGPWSYARASGVTTSETRSLTGRSGWRSLRERTDGGHGAFDEQVRLVVGEGERRPDHDQIAVRAVGAAGAGVQQQPPSLRGGDHAFGGPVGAGEGLFRPPVGHELHADHRPEPPDVAHVGRRAEPGGEVLQQAFAEVAAA